MRPSVRPAVLGAVDVDRREQMHKALVAPPAELARPLPTAAADRGVEHGRPAARAAASARARLAHRAARTAVRPRPCGETRACATDRAPERPPVLSTSALPATPTAVRYLRERFKKNHAWSLDSSSLRDMSFEKVAVESLPHQPESPPTRSSPLSLRMQACGDCADGSPRGQPTGYIRSVRSRALYYMLTGSKRCAPLPGGQGQ